MSEDIQDILDDLGLGEDDEDVKGKKPSGKKAKEDKPKKEKSGKKSSKKSVAKKEEPEKKEPEPKQEPRKEVGGKEGSICSRVIDINSVDPDPANREATAEEVEALACNIKEFGQLIPVIIDKTGIIIDGERRWRALKKLGKKNIEAIVISETSPAKIDPIQYAVNCIRENFDPKRQRAIIQMYKNQGKTQTQIAKILGLTQGRVSQILTGNTKKKADGKKKTAPVTSFEPTEGVKVNVKDNSITMSFEIGNDVLAKSYPAIQKYIDKLFKESTSGLKKDVESIRKTL